MFISREPLSLNSLLPSWIPVVPKFKAQYKVNITAPEKGAWKILCHQWRETPIVEARSMVEIYDTLAERIMGKISTSSDIKHIIGLAGPPGAGKSTLAFEVTSRVNKRLAQSVAVVLPMDGFHLYRSQLDAMENPWEAHARRGAPWTFDAALLLQCLKKLSSEGSVFAPSFDHCVGDPVADDVIVGTQHKAVIVEGNYLFFDEGFWNAISSMFEEKWYVDVNINTAMQRVLQRHISTGLSLDAAKWRIEYNDKPNAKLVLNSRTNADLIIRSVEL